VLPERREASGLVIQALIRAPPRKCSRWIDDNLPYSSLSFFPALWAVNINWHERSVRRVDSYAERKSVATMDQSYTILDLLYLGYDWN
jgi:hypothetical protein